VNNTSDRKPVCLCLFLFYKLWRHSGIRSSSGVTALVWHTQQAMPTEDAIQSLAKEGGGARRQQSILGRGEGGGAYTEQLRPPFSTCNTHAKIS